MVGSLFYSLMLTYGSTNGDAMLCYAMRYYAMRCTGGRAGMLWALVKKSCSLVFLSYSNLQPQINQSNLSLRTFRMLLFVESFSIFK